MKKLFLFFFLLSLVFLCLGKDKEKRIAFYELDNERIYKIPVYLNKGVTTVMFPAEIEAIHSASVALNTVPDNSNPAFLMAYTPGKYYFSIRALRLKAQGLLNIVYQGKTYIIEISENEENALSSVTFNGGGGGGYLNRRGNGYAVSPYLLKSLMDKAKAWDVLIKKYPNMSVDVTISTERRVSDYEHIQCSIQKYGASTDMMLWFSISSLKIKPTKYCITTLVKLPLRSVIRNVLCLWWTPPEKCRLIQQLFCSALSRKAVWECANYRPKTIGGSCSSPRNRNGTGSRKRCRKSTYIIW